MLDSGGPGSLRPFTSLCKEFMCPFAIAAILAVCLVVVGIVLVVFVGLICASLYQK